MYSSDINYYPERFMKAVTVSKHASGKPTQINFYADLAATELVMQHITTYDGDGDMATFIVRTKSSDNLI